VYLRIVPEFRCLFSQMKADVEMSKLKCTGTNSKQCTQDTHMTRPQSVLLLLFVHAQTENPDVFNVTCNLVKSICFRLSPAFESSCEYHIHTVLT
jgi:hypothetical protein